MTYANRAFILLSITVISMVLFFVGIISTRMYENIQGLTPDQITLSVVSLFAILASYGGACYFHGKDERQ